MRRLALALTIVVAAACAKAPDAGAPGGGSATGAFAGPDAIVLRFPRLGGTARAYRWWRDSSIWTSTQRVPAVTDAVAFDASQGILVMIDAARVPLRVDLRVGRVTPATSERLRAIASADGYAVFGVAPTGEIVRLTSSGAWRFRPPAPVRTLLPLPDGALLILSDNPDGRVTIRQVRPPETKVGDSTTIAGADLVIPTVVGDRIYFATGDRLEGLRTRDLEPSLSVTFSEAVRAVEPTPSGDRLFVAVKNSRTLYVVDRYESAVRDKIELPSAPIALRIDPDGQYLLARTEGGDSAHVIAMGTQRAIGTVATAWRPDLPMIAPDGGLALAIGEDLVILDADTKRERARISKGAADVWALVRWNGFRPRSSSLDEPVRFEDAYADSAAADTVAPLADASTAPPPSPVPPADAHAEPKSRGWMLSFAAVLSESRARAMAAAVRVEGSNARVQTSERDGATVYRVVAGPYASRDAAEEAGRRSGIPYWVFEATP
ncbi:MAG: SPOR domain-containing protein [Gemmatimonadota bacterium]|nr:SPOR domain-containing protein [Gemmatimonadota bacterium]